MADKDLRRHAQTRLDVYREKMDETRRAIARIDDQTMRFFEKVGTEPEREVTVERRAELVTKIAMLKELERLWEDTLERASA